MIIPRLKYDGKSLIKLTKKQQDLVNLIDEKIENGTYNLEVIDCNICGSNAKEKIGEKDRYGLKYQTNICTDCGLVYTSPRMNQLSYNLFYGNEYRNLYTTDKIKKKDFFYSQYHRATKIYEVINEKLDLSSPKNIIEVGCGSGGILHLFKEKGHHVTGCDLGLEYLEYGKKNWNLDLHHGFLSDLQKDKKADVIIYSHVLEHILDLNKELAVIKDYVHKDTVVYIEVPGFKSVINNFKSDFGLYFQNAHTFHFSLSSLTNLFRKNGYDIVYGDEYVRALFKINNNISLEKELINDYEGILSNIKTTEKNRTSIKNKFRNLKQKTYLLLIKVARKTGIKSIFQKIKLRLK